MYGRRNIALNWRQNQRMDQETIIAIPVEDHVKKYLLKNRFTKKPYRLSDADPFTSVLKLLMEPKRNSSLPVRYNPEKVIEVGLSLHKASNYKMYLPKRNAEKFNNWIERVMKDDLMKHIEIAGWYSEKVKIDKVIRNFELKYDLQNTKMSFQTLKRHFYRHRDDS